MPTPFTNALTNAVNKLTGTSVVDNETNPASALNMARRKALTKAVVKQPAPGKLSNGMGVGM